MQYRKLGKTGLKVSVIGFGGIPVQRIGTDEAAVVVKHAIELGINFFDTARGYTDSEAKLGAVLRTERDKVLIATKSMARTRKQMAADIEKSLDTMGIDHIDLFQMHNVKSPEELKAVLAPDGALAALEEARDKGLVGHIGVTGHLKDFLIEVIKTGRVETVQFPFNPVETNGVKELLELTGKMGLGVIVMKPLAGGAIRQTGLSLRYILEHQVSVAIPGMATIAEVEQNAGVGNDFQPLSAAEREQLAKEVKTLGANFCRRCEYCKPCTAGIDIPTVFLLDGYYQRYNLPQWAKKRYAGMEVKPDACQDCGECEERCPYHLPIRKMLKEAAKRLA